MTTYPRPEYAHDPDDVRAWLSDEERTALEAVNCPDLATTIDTRVLLREHNKRGSDGRKRVPSRDKWTEDQHKRASAASAKLEAAQDAFCCVRVWIHRIAAARRDGYVAAGVKS